jgi:flagellar hook protein FlgE
MNDSFITALNTQKTTSNWIDALSENMVNIYTPGFRESKCTFQTFLNGSTVGDMMKNDGQGKAIPGTSPENVFLEGAGFFVTKADGTSKNSYTRLGQFTFDKEGVYRDTDKSAVQGYILNDNGEMMAGTKTVDGDVSNIPTTDIKLWIDPGNGKYLGKYEEFEFGSDGILYGKADSGKVKVPLYKLAIMNFNNNEGLQELKQGHFIETADSGPPVAGRGEIRGGLIEMSNVDFRANISYYQQAKMQMELTNKLISTNKSLLEEALKLIS